MRQRLTIDEARQMPFLDLVETADSMLSDYAPGEDETEDQERDRLSKTLDEVPEMYRWFLTLQSYFAHWADAYSDQFGLKSWEYKSSKQRRDAMESIAKAAKLRYEGASRRVTIIQSFEQKMATGR